MKVKAICDIPGYYQVKEGQEYNVEAIVYFITPYFVSTAPTKIDTDLLRDLVDPLYSAGKIRNETVYILKTITETGRSTFARFNVANFEVTDATTPGSWIVRDIDLYRQVHMLRATLDYVDGIDETLNTLKRTGARITVMGDERMGDPRYLYDICDDNEV